MRNKTSLVFPVTIIAILGVFVIIKNTFILPVSASVYGIEWATGGVELSNTGGVDDQYTNRSVFTDSEGNVYYAWIDYASEHNTGSGQTYAQKLDTKTADLLWASEGVPATDNSGFNIIESQAVTDGVGGMITSWTDYRNGGTRQIYIQHLDSTGARQWTASGQRLLTSGINQDLSRIVEGSDNGAIVVFESEGVGGQSLLAQRVDASGASQWVGGVTVASTTTHSSPVRHQIVSDGSGGMYVVWQDRRTSGTTGTDIYIQRIDSAGAEVFTADGIIVVNATGDQTLPQIVGDGAGGAIVLWQDQRSGVDLYGQRIDSVGSTQWTDNGINLCCSSIDGSINTITKNGSGNIYAFWDDGNDIFGQALDSNGSALWGGDGLTVVDATGGQYFPHSAYIANTGVGVVWQDDRSGDNDVYAQIITDNQSELLPSDGLGIKVAPNIQSLPQVTSDSLGSLIVTWIDEDSGFAFKSQKVSFLYQIGNLVSALDARNQYGENIELGSIDGENGLNRPVFLTDNATSLRVAEVTVDIPADLGWDAVNGGASLSEKKSFVSDLISADGVIGLITLYVPRSSSDIGVVICPGAADLPSVTQNCSGAISKTETDADTSIVTIDSQSYWEITDLSGTGGISIAAATSTSSSTITTGTSTSSEFASSSLPNTAVFNGRNSIILGLLLSTVGIWELVHYLKSRFVPVSFPNQKDTSPF